MQVPDDFAHEQCLVIKQDGKHWLLSGCSHNGIPAFELMKDIMGDKLIALHSGEEL